MALLVGACVVIMTFVVGACGCDGGRCCCWCWLGNAMMCSGMVNLSIDLRGGDGDAPDETSPADGLHKTD